MNLNQDQDQPQRTRADINRENAQKSTGPRTPEGKKIASLNALRHGLSGHVQIMTSDDMQAYQKFCADYIADLKPKGPHEHYTAQLIIDTTWTLNRAHAMETHVLALAFDDRADKTVTDFDQTHAAIATALGLTGKLPDLNTLSLHQQRLARTLARHLKELREVQATRKTAERKALEEAARLLLLHQHENPAPPQAADGAQLQAPQYNPALDGFVLSTAEILLHIDREDRCRRAQTLETNRLCALGGR